MIDKKQVISHKLFKLLLGSNRKKKRVLFLTFLIITFLLSSTITYVPGSKASEIENIFRQPSNNVEFVGRWPYGACLVSCSQQQTEDVEKGRYLSRPAPDEDGVMKILVYYDMEGISGQNDIRSLSSGPLESTGWRSGNKL